MIRGATEPAGRHLCNRQQVLTIAHFLAYRWNVDIEASARKHGVPDEDMVHALRHHWRAFETGDPAVVMFIGPSSTGEPLEIGVVTDADGTAIIHAMKARDKFLRGWK